MSAWPLCISCSGALLVLCIWKKTFPSLAQSVSAHRRRYWALSPRMVVQQCYAVCMASMTNGEQLRTWPRPCNLSRTEAIFCWLTAVLHSPSSLWGFCWRAAEMLWHVLRWCNIYLLPPLCYVPHFCKHLWSYVLRAMKSLMCLAWVNMASAADKDDTPDRKADCKISPLPDK